MMALDVLALLGQVPEEWLTTNPIYCGQEGCGVFMPETLFASQSNGNEKTQSGACIACNENTCRKCKQMQAAHNNLCGKCPRRMVSPEIYAFTKENGLAQCPACKTLLELVDGCNSVQ
jgi:hypothetical protein